MKLSVVMPPFNEYVGRIYLAVRRRPFYIIKGSHNIDSAVQNE